jgi:putative Ca2+/H+ antiporter (TMEM165/GDT1 family)
MAGAPDRTIRIGETDDADPLQSGRGETHRRVHTRPRRHILEPVLVSTWLVALAEIGDKTQLLAIILAAKFRRPLPIIAGICAATLLNHAGAAAAGYFAARWLTGPAFQTAVGVAFIAMAGWALVPDKVDDGGAGSMGRYGVFLATLAAFFLVEMGDKTQIATSLLAARFGNISLVTFGTTLGMMLANVPAVLLGEAVTRVVALKYVRMGAAAVFAAIGAWILLATWVMP